MNILSTSLALVPLLAASFAAVAQAPAEPAQPGAEKNVPVVGDKEPVLRVEAGGPTSLVTSLAFGPDDRTLYAGGFDKVVRVWDRGPGAKPFRYSLNPRMLLRIWQEAQNGRGGRSFLIGEKNGKWYIITMAEHTT